MTDIRFKLSPPWTTFVNELEQLFGHDRQITIKYDDGGKAVRLYVNNDKKAAVLAALLPKKKVFGNVNVTISVVPANGCVIDVDFDGMTFGKIFDVAFEDNPVYVRSVDIDGMFSNVITYVVFKKEVVQFFNDNLNDINGNCSTLYQEIASDVFEDLESVFFCTDNKSQLEDGSMWP